MYFGKNLLCASFLFTLTSHSPAGLFFLGVVLGWSPHSPEARQVLYHQATSLAPSKFILMSSLDTTNCWVKLSLQTSCYFKVRTCQWFLQMSLLWTCYSLHYHIPLGDNALAWFAYRAQSLRNRNE